MLRYGHMHILLVLCVCVRLMCVCIHWHTYDMSMYVNTRACMYGYVCINVGIRTHSNTCCNYYLYMCTYTVWKSCA